MESICEKFLVIFKLNNLSNNLNKFEKIVNNVNSDYNVNKFINNSMKPLKISVECNACDVNEDKLRQCYKQLKCFWPKCRYSCDQKGNLKEHISRHLNERSFFCEECNKQFHQNSSLHYHKRYFHSNERHFVCPENDCNKSFKAKIHLNRHP